MAVTMMRQESAAPCSVYELRRGEEQEVLDFLGKRPLHTVVMASSIHENGLASPHNRGSFYGCRGTHGQLDGVALLGHATLLETRDEVSIANFARLARRCQIAHLIRGERKAMESFWKYYAGDGVRPRRTCNELLFEQSEILPAQQTVAELRQATVDDIDKVIAVNAIMAFEENGISPLKRDPGGFRRRTARRIEQGRIWVLTQANRLIFKADVVAMTPQVAYLEGVHVHPDERRKGYGLHCLTQLCATLLGQAKSICLTTNQRNQKAAAFYQKAGFKFHSDYETIYVS